MNLLQQRFQYGIISKENDKEKHRLFIRGQKHRKKRCSRKYRKCPLPAQLHHHNDHQHTCNRRKRIGCHRQNARAHHQNCRKSRYNATKCDSNTFIQQHGIRSPPIHSQQQSAQIRLEQTSQGLHPPTVRILGL